MKSKKSALFFPVLLTLLTIGVAAPNSNVEAASTVYDCNPNSARVKALASTNAIQAYVDSIGVPYEKYISKSGKKNPLTINKTYLTDRCLIVYGTPDDVKKDGRKLQETGANGEPKFLGYDQNGNPFANPEYPDYKGGQNYIKSRKFIEYPWKDSGLQAHLKTSTTQPNTVNPDSSSAPQPTYTDSAAKELDRAIDRMYLKKCTGSCSLGKRGNFTETNTELKHNLKGSNLVRYASVNGYPDKYVAGTFELYYYSTKSKKYWYSTWYLPPYKEVLSEKSDLRMRIKEAPTSVVENQSYTVKYQLCNLGESSVVKPKIYYQDGKTEKNQTLNITLKPNGCYEGSISTTAPSVSSNTDKVFYIDTNSNGAGNNPVNEDDTTNNKAEKTISIKNNQLNASVSVKSHTPTNPHSNQQTTFTIEVCNKSLTTANNIVVKYGFKGSSTSSKTISSLKANDCTDITDKRNAPKLQKYSGNVTYEANLTFSGDTNSSDNKSSKTVTIKNPDAKVDIISSTTSSTSGIGDIKVKITNKMNTTIKQSCGSSCATPTTGRPDAFRIRVYDTKFTDDTSDDTWVMTSVEQFSLAAGASQTFTIPGSDLYEHYIKDTYKTTYQLVQFRVEAEIPHYAGEVNFEGNPSYDNNADEDYIVYYPERPPFSATKCNVVQHSYVSYFTTNGTNPIKICMGHFPTYPSTTVEGGMQAYHFVLYRFFPTPIPKYTVTTAQQDETDPNHFSQLFTLPSTEAANQMGDPESMFFPNKTANGYYQERGRYMPTSASFNFKVYKKDSQNNEGETIALGTISYDIPSSCYNKDTLDIRHQYGCDEILFFLPNYDTDVQKHEKPDDYSSDDVIYPIKNTKIPYLNPGNYRFEFNASESFRYYYQTNNSTSGYEWGVPKFK